MAGVIAFLATLLPAGCAALSARQAGATRRAVLGGATAALSSAHILSAPAAAADGSSDAVLRLLSRVPTFVVTNRESQPYLTQVNERGRRSGYFYLSPREALRELQQLRSFDPAASLVVTPLESIWFDLPQTEKAAAAALESAPQPKAGTSSDLRLFSLAPLEDEDPSPLPLGSVPLFYDRDLLLEVDGESRTPYFFRRADLRRTFDEAQTDGTSNPDVKVVALPALVNQLSERKSKGPAPILVAASEAVQVVGRLGQDNQQSSADAGPAADTPATLPSAQKDLMERLVLTTPFGGGARSRSRMLGLF